MYAFVDANMMKQVFWNSPRTPQATPRGTLTVSVTRDGASSVVCRSPTMEWE